MEPLREVFRVLGFSEVASFLASGNIVFETAAFHRAAGEGSRKLFTMRGMKTVKKMAANYASAKD